MTKILTGVLAVLLAGGAVAWIAGSAEGQEREHERVPGTIRIEGEARGSGRVRAVRAFPELRFRRPLWIGRAGDGSDRLFVVEQDGRIRSFENRPDADETELVLDLTDRVYRGHNEEGLLGLAFHPDFAENRRVFLHYSAADPRRGVVSEFEFDRKLRTISPRSERVVLEQEQPWGNHNGGDLHFGPDGMLYISFGDGGAGGDPLGSGQDLSTWLGAILRIDVDGRKPYAVPKDNPFVSRRGVRPEIWAYGLRNVWRMSFDRLTGELWGGDVGQNLWEEIHVIEKGGNHGWAIREGRHPFKRRTGGGPFVEPVAEHARDEARSITGGFVYRGRRVPSLLGAYVYADYATGTIWALRRDGDGYGEPEVIGRQGGISSFGEDEAGELYFTAFDGFVYGFEERAAADASAHFPTRLSDVGLFTDLAKPTPHPSLIPYDVNMPLWSDGAGKERFLMLPGEERIRVADDGSYAYPEGTIFVKTFLAPSGTRRGRAPERRLETRIMVLRDAVWEGYTYVWDSAQSEAYLIDGRETTTYTTQVRSRDVERTWTFPGRGDCTSCHTGAGGHVLGFRAEQLDREDADGGNQLDRLVALDVFEGDPRAGGAKPFPDWSEATTDVERSARAYLDANCAMCHQPGGPGNAKIDLRASTDLMDAHLLFERPGQGDLGVDGAEIVRPGDPKRSLLILRMARTDEKGMPNLAHGVVDEKAVELVTDWVRGLDEGR